MHRAGNIFDWFLTQVASQANRLRQFGRPPEAANDDLAPLENTRLVQNALDFVSGAWDGLRRDCGHTLHMLEDPEKMPKEASEPASVFISSKQNAQEAWETLTAGLDGENARERIQLYQLDAHEPDNLEKAVPITPTGELMYLDSHEPPPHGFLYLPHPYLVPGGRFNEMYGSDGYHINRGLIREGRMEDALNMLENMLYEVEHYGMILNANRTYQMGRTHPPLLTRMLLEFCDALEQGGHDLSAIEARLEGDSPKEMAQYYLLRAVPQIRRQHDYWLQEMFKAGDTGLSRYMDKNGAPTAEVEFAEPNHWLVALEELRELYAHDPERWRVFYDPQKHALTEEFFRGDRAMRASMYDPSRRHEAMSADIIHHATVGLNSLLYKMEMDMAEIFERLKDLPVVQRNAMDSLALCSRESAEARAGKMREYLWHEEHGFVDYRFSSKEQRDYPFVTGFYPMWVGLATEEEAAIIVEHLLPKLETEHGLAVSNRESGGQWDYPYMWAPKLEIVTEGLLDYGYKQEAYRIIEKSLNTMLRNFDEHGTFFEKYNAEDGSVRVDTKMGYNVNVHDEYGFGWSNAAFGRLLERYIDLSRELAPDKVPELMIA